jgi:hypothetical protein
MTIPIALISVLLREPLTRRIRVCLIAAYRIVAEVAWLTESSTPGIMRRGATTGLIGQGEIDAHSDRG